MKCDDFLPALMTGGMIRRARAHLHAVGCGHCRAVRERFSQAVHQSANPTALTAADREVWRRAISVEQVPSPRKVPLAAKWALATAAILVAIVTGVVLTRLPHRPATTEVAQKAHTNRHSRISA